MKHLQKGNCVGIVAPASFIPKGNRLEDAIQLLKSWGLQVRLGNNVFKIYKHFAGTDKERSNDLQTFLDDASIHAIWFARGGYGSIRIIEKLNFTKFKKNPKWLIGYSDFTVFHQIVNTFNLESIHAFLPTSMDTFLEKNTAIDSLQKALFGKDLVYKISSNSHNKLGKVTGEIIGGNLAIISSLLGTKYAIKPTNKILFIEDIGEYKYRIDRMLRSLKLNGYFEHCIGLLLGNFTNIPVNEPNFEMSLEEIVLEIIKEYDFPVCFDFPAGHIANNNALIFGRKTSLEIQKKDVTLQIKNN